MKELIIIIIITNNALRPPKIFSLESNASGMAVGKDNHDAHAQHVLCILSFSSS